MSQFVANNDHVDVNTRRLRTPPIDSCHLQQFLSPQMVKNIYEASPNIRRPLQVIHSPRNFSTPKKFNDASGKETSSIISYSYKALPKYATPPSQSKEFVVKNPFDADLNNKLHLPIFSPSVFNTCVSPSKELQESFCWTIDDLSNIHPAPIDENFLDVASDVFSPETETRTQQAIDSYFCTTNPALQSPWPSAVTRTKSFCPTLDLEPEAIDETHPSLPCHASTQTDLSLPPILPADLEMALKPYFTQGKQDRAETDSDSGLETSSSRRLLFEPSESSPVQSSSALKCGLLYWPNLLRSKAFADPSQSRCSPFLGQRNQRSPSVSPVTSGTPASLRKSSASARLDFSEHSMSVDRSFSVRYYEANHSFEGEDVSMSSRPETPRRTSLR